MTKKDLKLFAGEIVKESDYSIDAKKQLFNFILNEASDIQLKSLVINKGKLEKVINEDTIQIVNERFDNLIEKSDKENLSEIKEFIEIGKDVIYNVVESNNYKKEDKNKIYNFVNNEAADYQILSMIFEEKLPEEKENLNEEIRLVENLGLINENFILSEAGNATYWAMKGKKYVNKAAAAASPATSKVKSAASSAMSNPKARYYSLKAKKYMNKGVASGSGMLDKLKALGTTHYKNDVLQLTKGQQIVGGIGALAAVALISYAAYKIYKNFLSKAAMACKGSQDKSACMKQYKIKATQVQISELTKRSSMCNKSKDPQKCKAAIQQKIMKLKSKIA